ncbi:hypothetical protein JTE90_017309 [Oedothorax gibbosus]|uniref:Vitellogenin-2 n=1 Tax=Oedothorax gibbosus TaxID=931172 RepID=A0AAV6UCX1_9ARAC|nr:hypothetical protein JTE90_017309 [Oedothorax gibbosus]
MYCLALVFAALAATATATGYIDGREYVYKYNGQIYTGYPRIKNQESGYAFHADVIIQPHGDYAFMKVDHVQKTQFNGEFEDVEKHPHTYVDLPEVAGVLTHPFKVYRKHGVVTHFEVSKDEPTFAVNMKRGLINLFSLNFEEMESTSPSTEENDIHQPDPTKHYYTTFEKGIMGDCETAYVVEHHPYFKTPHNNIVLNVTKTKNYHNCKSHPNQVYGVFHGHECGEAAEHEKSHTLHGSAVFHYDIRGHRHHYVIEKIDSVGEVAYTPYPLEGQTVSTIINRHLELVEERDVTTPLAIEGEAQDYDSLIYDFDFQHGFKDPVDLHKPHYLYHLTGRKVPLDQIYAQFDELIHVYDDETYHDKIKDKNFPDKFVELLRSVGTIGYEEIEALYHKYAEIPKTDATADQKKYRSLFVDVIVNIGTNPALLFGKYLIEHKLVKIQEAAYFFTQIPLHVKEVSQTLLDELQHLCEHDSLKKYETAHISCVFALSTLVHDHCVARYHPEGPEGNHKHSCKPEDAVKYFEYVAHHFESATDDKLKAAYLKAGGIMGLREILPYARPYIEGAGHPHRYFRTQALWSVLNVGWRFPDKVRDLLVPLLFNQTENYELRLTSFLILMMYKPQLYQIEGLARALKHDKDDQVRSYIHSYFQHLANSTHPCDRRVSKDAHYALRILDDVHHEFDHYDYTFSHHHYAAGYDPHYDFGGSTTFAYFASDSGYVPRAAYLGLEDFIGGQSFQTLGVGFKQYGLEKFFDKIFGPEGSFGQRSVFDLFKKRGKRDTSGVEKELNEIKAKIHLPTLESEDIHGEFFMKYMGNTLSFFHFDEKTFEDFFREGRFSIPNLPALYHKIPEFFYQRFMLNVDKLYVIPSESGLPIIFDYKQPLYYYHKNKESSFRVEPGFFPEERGGKFPEHVKFETDGHIAVDKEMFAYTGAIIPFDGVIFGAGISRRSTLSLPLKMKFDLEVKEKTFHAHWTPVAHDIYSFSYQPYTFVDSYLDTVPLTLEQNFHPVHRLSQQTHNDKFFHDALGFGFDVHSTYENDFNSEGAWLSFLFDKDYREKFYYLYANPNFEPYDVDVHFGVDDTKEVDFNIKYHYYDNEHSEEEFAANGFEDYHLNAAASDRGPFCTCSLEAEVVGHGDKERKAHAAASWTRDLKRTFHKVNFFYDRTPFASSETEHLKVCGSSFLKYPKRDLTKVATLETIGMDHKVESELKVHFGKDCSSDQKIKVEGHFDTSEEQRDLEAHRDVPDTPEHYNPYAHYYQLCLHEREHGENWGDNCMEYIHHITELHEYEFNAKYEHLSPRFLNFTNKVGGFLRHVLYNYADHNVIDVHHPEHEIHVHANISVHLPVADIRVSKPHSESHYTHVYTPYHHGFNSFPFFEDIHVKNSMSESKCKLEGDHVVTFDHYEYNLPPINCYKVIAKDCSKSEFFTVLGSKITHPKYHKALKVFLGKHKIEALPVTDDSDIIIRVDGKRVPVANDAPYLHYEGEDHSHGADFYVTFRDFYYALHSEKYGLIVEFDGHAIVIQASPYYRHKLCGLCGDFNGQKYDGYTAGDGCHYDTDEAYAYAYSIPSDTCEVPKFEKKCPDEGGFGCTKLRTKIVEKTTGKVPMTCFSTEPVAECSTHCKARATTKQTIHFHCLPSSDDSTKSLVRQQTHRVIHEVRRKSQDHEAEVEVPDVCLKTSDH